MKHNMKYNVCLSEGLGKVITPSYIRSGSRETALVGIKISVHVGVLSKIKYVFCMRFLLALKCF